MVLWSVAKAMKFNHLPEPGGIYDQDPELLKQWTIIWTVEAQIKKEQADNQSQAGSSKGTLGGHKLKPSAI